MRDFRIGERVVYDREVGTIVEEGVDGYALTVEFDNKVGFHGGRSGNFKFGYCRHFAPNELKLAESYLASELLKRYENI